jgi:hypothetical protein
MSRIGGSTWIFQCLDLRPLRLKLMRRPISRSNKASTRVERDIFEVPSSPEFSFSTTPSGPRSSEFDQPKDREAGSQKRRSISRSLSSEMFRNESHDRSRSSELCYQRRSISPLLPVNKPPAPAQDSPSSQSDIKHGGFFQQHEGDQSSDMYEEAGHVMSFPVPHDFRTIQNIIPQADKGYTVRREIGDVSSTEGGHNEEAMMYARGL